MPDPPTSSSSCSSGGQFYTRSGSFLGCCTIKQCTDHDACPSADLKPASSNATYYRGFHCRTESFSLACENTDPSFIGCCKTSFNASASECPDGHLTQGQLSLAPAPEANFLSEATFSISYTILPSASSPTATKLANTPTGADLEISTGESLATSTSVSGSVPTANFVGPSARKTTTPTSSSVSGSVPTANFAGLSAPKTATPTPKSNTAAIAGGVAGGIVGLAFLIALLTIYCRQRTTRPLQDLDKGESLTWGPGNARSLQKSGAELEEIKQGPSSISLPRPPSPLPLTSNLPLPLPPAHTPYRSHGNELNRPPDLSQPSASSPYPSHDLPSPESPPSPPPLKTRLSQHSADHYSDEPNVSPISLHYQHQPLDENGRPMSSIYSEVSSSELLHTHSMRS